MISRLDHVVIAVRDLDAAVRRYQAIGFDVRPGGRHTGLGTYNALIRFGLDYLELLSVFDEAEARRNGRDDIVQFLKEHDGALARYALASSNLDEDARRFQKTGFEATGPYPMQRLRPDGHVLSWRLLVPRTPTWRSTLPFLIQWDQGDEQRLAWDGIGEHANCAFGIARVAVVTRDLAATSDTYERKLGLGAPVTGEVIPRDAKQSTFALGRFRIELREPIGPGAAQRTLAEIGEGLQEIEIAVRDLIAMRSILAKAGVKAEPVDSEEDALHITPSGSMGAHLVFRAQKP
jgi:catechol 2,3-dioxygenase-like lactoylglutathione lyase family enzyme